MDSKAGLKPNHKKKKSEPIISKLVKPEGGIPRIPKTFVFDQNLPKEEYLKYISPENIIPESLEVATKIFSNYRKHTGTSKMGKLNQIEIPQILKPKASLPFFDHPKTSGKEFSTHRDGVVSYETSVIQEMKQSSRKKGSERLRHDEIIQESIGDLKGMFKDIPNLATQDQKNLEHTDGQQFSLQKARSSLRNGEESTNQSKLMQTLNLSKLKPQEKEGSAGQNLAKENNEKHQHKKSEGELSHKLTHKKKKPHEEYYQVSDLDNTQEIVRKTEVAVRTLSKRSEVVKREMKNFEETVKAQLKETETVPITSLRAVSLVRDFVFNEEEFAKLIEEEDMEEEREKAQREYNQRKKRKEKKRTNSSKPAESKLKASSGAMSARLDHIPFPRTSPRNDLIVITKEEKNKVDEAVKKIVAVKEDELHKQVDVQLKIHEKYGVFSSDNNLFRINSMNYTKIMKEKEKIREHLMKELKNSKYKEREAKMLTAQSHRIRPRQSDMFSQGEAENNKNEEKGFEGTSKEDFKALYINRIKEVLTKPVKDNIGSKPPDYATHVKRLDGLKKKYVTTDIERVNQITYHNL